MSGDLVALVEELSPYVTAAVSAYGGAVLAQAQEEAADATVGWGRKILQRIFGVASEKDAPEAVTDLAASPDDGDLQAALRVQMKKLLATDQALVDEVRALVGQAVKDTGAQVRASGRGVAAGRDITGPVTTGDHSPITGR
ncbi:hypothetical protein ABGB17_20915 [Sphaerisporangium sp. B11E5]|uniref:hypothetical protein n=1 Tax=Sphaerisporangium sp. B11E5 TaxID=3153563 RepID=UPI00325C762C